MLKIYNVYSGRLHIDFVLARSQEEACKIVLKKWGDPRTYTNTSDGTYWAKEA
jgi:hypothetical protein